MKYGPLTFIGLLNHIENCIDFTTVGLLRETGEQSSRDMFQFQVEKYLRDETSKTKPDTALRFFDFNGFARDWLSPTKQVKIDTAGHLSLAEIVKDVFHNIELPKGYNKKFTTLIRKANKKDAPITQQELTLHFFSLLNNKKIDPNFTSAIIRFIQFSRMILANNQVNKMGLEQTAKMMAPCFTKLLFGTAISPSDIRSYSAFFQNVLECCLPLTPAQFDCLVPVNKKITDSKTQRQAFIDNLFKSHSEGEASSSTSPYSSSSSSTTTSLELSPTDSSALLFNDLRLSEPAIFEFAKSGNVAGLSQYFSNKPNAAELVDSKKSIFDRSLLHVATLFQQPDVIRFLHSIGASINVIDKHGRTPLHYAVASETYFKPFDIPTVTALLEMPGATVSAKTRKDRDHKSAIHVAAEHKVSEAFQDCLEKQKVALHTRLTTLTK